MLWSQEIVNRRSRLWGIEIWIQLSHSHVTIYYVLIHRITHKWSLSLQFMLLSQKILLLNRFSFNRTFCVAVQLKLNVRWLHLLYHIYIKPYEKDDFVFFEGTDLKNYTSWNQIIQNNVKFERKYHIRKYNWRSLIARPIRNDLQKSVVFCLKKPTPPPVSFEDRKIICRFYQPQNTYACFSLSFLKICNNLASEYTKNVFVSWFEGPHAETYSSLDFLEIHLKTR